MSNQNASGNNGCVMVLATAALCTCSLIHAFVLISVFPYAGYMVMDLLPRLTPERAGPYAGFLSSSFMAGRTVSSYPWGRLADVYGRKFVLITSLILSALFSVLFGMSQSFVMAMVWRFCLGLSNGIVGTVKTVVSELAHDNPPLETRMMGLVVGMRAWGFLISPAVGGWLAEPTKQYPSLWESHTGTILSKWLWVWLSRYPFILPNLAGAIVCLASALVVGICIQETLPSDELRGIKYIPEDLVASVRNSCTNALNCCRQSRKNNNTESSLLIRPMQQQQQPQKNLPYHTDSESVSDTDANNSHNTTNPNKPSSMTSLWNNQPTRNHLIPYWFFSFVVVCLDEAFPLFCISTKGGLSLPESEIGKVLSMAGLVFALCQYLVYTTTVHRVGLYPSLSLGSFLGFFPVLFMPFSLILGSSQQQESGLSWKSFWLLMAVMAVSKIFSCMFFTSMSIALNKTVESSQRGSLNGLANFGGSIAKGIGPIVAGFLVTASFSSALVPAKYGSIIIFTCIGLMGMATVGQLVGLKPN